MRQLIFWDFPRMSWKYDVVVALILAFIFLTPRELFKDQPRAVGVVQIPSPPKEAVFWIDPVELRNTPVELRGQRAVELVQRRTGKKMQLIRLETVADPGDEVKGFMAFLKP
jgi:hypothetical protein